MSFPRFDSDCFIAVKMSSHQPSAKPRSSKCRHFCFLFDTHNYCPTHRESGKGDNPCITNQSSCNIYASFSEEQQIKIKHRRWYVRKQKALDPCNTSKEDDLNLLGDDVEAFSVSQADLEGAAENLFSSPPHPQPLHFKSFSLKTSTSSKVHSNCPLSEYAPRHSDLESKHSDHHSESEQPKRVCSKAKKHSDKRMHKVRAKYYSQSSSSEEDESSVQIKSLQNNNRESSTGRYTRLTSLHNMMRKWKLLGKFLISLIPGIPCLGPLPLC